MEGIAEALTYFGGVPDALLTDNAGSSVSRVERCRGIFSHCPK